MGESVDFTRQPVLSQLLKLIDKQKFVDLRACSNFIQ
jgi:hypothetical protein